ncbi:hypothetical protein PInf_021526 [Phytophthora infestans]|nr:hypothetical protein PInf_021526 [Phytophthora infestans]
MRLSYILVAVVSTLFAHHDTASASTGTDVALAGVLSLGLLHLVSADQSFTEPQRLLSGNHKVGEGIKEERGFKEVVEEAMAKFVVDKVYRTNSFSALEKLEKTLNLPVLEKALVLADDKMKGAFKFAEEAKMNPADMAKIVKDFPDFTDAEKMKTVLEYTNYLKTMGKLD